MSGGDYCHNRRGVPPRGSYPAAIPGAAQQTWPGLDPPEQVLPLTGLIFDMGDVLYDATAWRRWLLMLLSHLGVRTSYSLLFRVWDRDYLDHVHRGTRCYAEAFATFLQSVGLSAAQIDEVVAASNARKRELEETRRPFPGVAGTLEKLHGDGIRMGILSDCEASAEKLHDFCDAMGIGDYFTAIVSSADLKCTKPHRRCYETALVELGTTAAETAFVGHDAEELTGARFTGMRTIAFNYDPDVRAHAYLGRFDELLPLAIRWRAVSCVA